MVVSALADLELRSPTDQKTSPVFFHFPSFHLIIVSLSSLTARSFYFSPTDSQSTSPLPRLSFLSLLHFAIFLF